jgi:hypothetical protein
MGQEIKHLFRKKPTPELVSDILKSLHFTGLEDGRLFHKSDIPISAFEEWLPLLEPYYLPCKAKLFLHNFTSNKAITVLRHLLRSHGYKLRAYEKVHQGVKQTLYQIEREVWGDLSGCMDVNFD